MIPENILTINSISFKPTLVTILKTLSVAILNEVNGASIFHETALLHFLNHLFIANILSKPKGVGSDSEFP